MGPNPSARGSRRIRIRSPSGKAGDDGPARRIAGRYRLGAGEKPRRKLKWKRRATDTIFGVSGFEWSEWRDSNPRPLVPQTSALTGLRYTPTAALIVSGGAPCNAALPWGCLMSPGRALARGFVPPP